MELYILEMAGRIRVVLLDDEMRIVKPVYNYLEFQRQKDRALNTLKANGNDLRLYWQFLNYKGYKFDEVTPEIMTDFIDWLRSCKMDILALNIESARTGKTINRILSTVYQFYKYCGAVNEINNPIFMEDIDRPFNMFKNILHHAKMNNRTKHSIFKVKESDHAVHLVTDYEMSTFLSALDKRRDKLIYKTLYLTGARIQEVLDLEIESVPIPDRSKPVGILQKIKSKGKNRDLYVPMSLIEELDDFILCERSRVETDHSYIFVSEQPQNLGKQLTYRAAYDKLKRVQGELGMDFNFHDLRHSLCSYLIESSMDTSLVQIVMGHAHLSTTQLYTHLSNPYITESLKKYWNKSTLTGGVGNDN